MPRRRVKPRDRRDEPITKSQAEYLLRGWWLDPEPFDSEDQTRDCWLQHRDEIIALAKSDKEAGRFRSHTAPWAWWAFEAPEPRRQIAGPEPFSPMPLWFGRPRGWNSFEDSEAAVFETEEAYFERLKIDPVTLR